MDRIRALQRASAAQQPAARRGGGGRSPEGVPPARPEGPRGATPARASLHAGALAALALLGCDRLGIGTRPDPPRSASEPSVQVNPSGVRVQQPNEPTVETNPNGVRVQQPNEPTVQVNQGSGNAPGTTTTVQPTAPGEPSVAVQNAPAQGTQVNVGGIQITVPTVPGQPTQPAQPAPSAAGHPPIVCDGVQSVVLSNVNIGAGTEPAVTASGSCQVQLSHCTLASMGVAVRASGNARVSLVQCTVTGAAGALEASGSAQIQHTRSTLQGGARSEGLATIRGG